MEHDFLGLGLTPIALEQRSQLEPLLLRHPAPLCDYSFASLILWSPVYHHAQVVIGDGLLLSCVWGCGPTPTLLQPHGELTPDLQARILDHARRLPSPLRISSVSEEFLERHPAFVRHFDVQACRDRANYVYAVRDLAQLAGRRYASKRNWISQARRLYAHSVEALSPDNAADCLQVGNDIACRRTEDAAISFADETLALQEALRRFGPLGLRGLLLRVEGRPAAFSIYDRLLPGTAVVLFERALREHKGLSQVINQETARVMLAEGFEWVNREEDLGDPGLRMAKQSYHPLRLEPSYVLTLRETGPR